jgi:hypothetical protein
MLVAVVGIELGSFAASSSLHQFPNHYTTPPSHSTNSLKIHGPLRLDAEQSKSAQPIFRQQRFKFSVGILEKRGGFFRVCLSGSLLKNPVVTIYSARDTISPRPARAAKRRAEALAVARGHYSEASRPVGWVQGSTTEILGF